MNVKEHVSQGVTVSDRDIKKYCAKSDEVLELHPVDTQMGPSSIPAGSGLDLDQE